MCKYCDTDRLNEDTFDSFFQGASVQGYKSMICKHCSRTFVTEFVTLADKTTVVADPVRRDEECNLPLITI